MSHTLRPLRPVWRALRRAGAYGALHGGQSGLPRLGVTVPVHTSAELQATLTTLQDAGVTLTLLIPEPLTRAAPQLLRAATWAGHELAGSGLPHHLTLLEAVSGQPVRTWDARDLGPHDLRYLAQQGVHPLPEPQAEPFPGHTLLIPLVALAEHLRALRNLGYQADPVSDLPGLRPAAPRDLLRWLYQRLVEEPYARQSHVITPSQRPDALLRVAPLDHAPAPLPFPHRTPTAELHLDSAKLVGLAGQGWLGTYRAYQRSYHDIARALHTHPALQDAQVIFGVSLFHGPMQKAGFQVIELPPLRARWYALGFRVLRRVHGTTRTPSDPTPKLAWMTREEFLQRYGQ